VYSLPAMRTCSAPGATEEKCPKQKSHKPESRINAARTRANLHGPAKEFKSSAGLDAEITRDRVIDEEIRDGSSLWGCVTRDTEFNFLNRLR
jgi:hypothetical protein